MYVPHFQLMNNEEITNIVKILGLHYTKKYSESSELRSLRYGRLLIMTDQDQDGSHIKGLIINFLHHTWPGLLRQNFVQEFITPIVKVCVWVCVWDYKGNGREQRKKHNVCVFQKGGNRERNITCVCLEKRWEQRSVCGLLPSTYLSVQSSSRTS